MNIHIKIPEKITINKEDNSISLNNQLCEFQKTLILLKECRKTNFEFIYEEDIFDFIFINGNEICKPSFITYENPQELISYLTKEYQTKINEIECYLNKDKTFEEIIDNEALKLFGIIAPTLYNIYHELKDIREISIPNGYIQPRNNKNTPQHHADSEELTIKYRDHLYSIEISPKMTSYCEDYYIYCDGNELLSKHGALYYQHEVNNLLEALDIIKENSITKASNIIKTMKECNHKISINTINEQSVLTIDFSGRTFNFTDDEIIELLKKATE